MTTGIRQEGFWSAVIVAVIPAVVGGALAYFGAKRGAEIGGHAMVTAAWIQATSAIDQAVFNRDTQRIVAGQIPDPTEAYLERLAADTARQGTEQAEAGTATPTPPGLGGAEEAVFDYYANLTNGSTALGWRMLTSDFQRTHNVDNYFAYESFWLAEEPVTVKEAITIEQVGNTAELFVRLLWTGDNTERAYRFLMVQHPASGNWLIDDVLPATGLEEPIIEDPPPYFP